MKFLITLLILQSQFQHKPSLLFINIIIIMIVIVIIIVIIIIMKLERFVAMMFDL